MLLFLIRFSAKSCLGSAWEHLHNQIQCEREQLAAHWSAAPPLLAQMLLVSGEDRRHGQHSGFDVRAIARAIWRNTTSRRREGASTIEQQIVRVLTGRFERSLSRKVREILLASLVAYTFPKAILPALYLRIGYYGWRMNGFEQACIRLRLSPASMTLSEAAELVARLKYPEPRVPPGYRLEQIRCRRDYLSRLHLTHLRDGTYDHIHPRWPSEAFHKGNSAVASARVVPAA